MSLPNLIHFFNRNILCLRQKGKNEDRHDKDEAGKEEEEAILHVTKHGKEKLANDKCEEHVNRYIDGLSC